MPCPSISASSVQAYEDCMAPAQGLQKYRSYGALEAALKAACVQTTPAGAPALSYTQACEAMLRARGLLYAKVNAGDCGAPPAVQGVNSGQITGLSGTAASGVIGGLGAAGIIAGPLTLGITAAIGLAVAGIEMVFSHHAQAVANEQSTICSVAGYFNQAITQIDAAVQSGGITPYQGITFLKQVSSQAQSGLASIMQKCNAACFYQGFCQAHAIFAQTYYPYIAPIGIGAAAPGAAPVLFDTTPGGVSTGTMIPPPAPVRSTPQNVYAPAIPGPAPVLTSPATVGVNSPYASDYLNQGYNQQTGQSVQAADTTASPDWTTIGAIAAVLALVVFLARG